MDLFQKCFLLLILSSFSVANAQQTLKSSDFYKMKSVKEAEISPDGKRSHTQLRITLRQEKPQIKSGLWIWLTVNPYVSLLKKDSGSGPNWSNDSTWIALNGKTGR